MDIIYDSAHEDADIIFGTTTNDNLAENEVKITLVATGFDENDTPKLQQTPVNQTQKTTLEAKPEAAPQQTSSAQSQQLTSPEDIMNSLRAKLTGNGNYIVENSNDLDIPTFLRKKMD